METLEQFRTAARAWLDANVARRPDRHDHVVWGEGSDSVALFKNLAYEEEKAHIDALRRWVATKADAGFANVSWEPQWGGRGLHPSYERAFAEEEQAYTVPEPHESVGITTHLIAPTIRAMGTEAQKQRFLRPMLRTDEMWCQLFSEPGAGSDLAGVATRAVRDGDEWVIDGQKVWTSGAQYADWGYVLCRTDPDVAKHKGLTAFIVPMAAPGVEVRPLRQMTGGSSFNEVFFTDVRVGDDFRLGEVGAGWLVALTTLSFERNASTGALSTGMSRRLVALAQHLGVAGDPVHRQALARAYTADVLLELTARRATAKLNAGETPGPEGSIAKLSWTEAIRLYADVASSLLGPRLVADAGEWGTYAWSELVLGIAGYRVAGGTDEVQRNIIGERVLGLPGEPRTDRITAGRDAPR
ncbi:MAG TPA: acyl-CoA dehydrogenase family protein [Acidimicrobiales bacterium]|nr:acyl-CoA dehydrogenase family protein [Acidimicrobiales bacterium]